MHRQISPFDTQLNPLNQSQLILLFFLILPSLLPPLPLPLILYLSKSLSFYFPPSPFTISFPPSLVPAIYVSKNTNTMPLFCQLFYSLLSLSKRWSIMWSKKLCRVSIFIIERYQKISTKSSLSNLQENLKKVNET